MMKNIFECDLFFCKYRCICVDIGNILVGLLHSSLSHLNQRKTNFVSKSSWIYFSINKFTSVLTFLTVLLIIIYLVCRTLIRCFETFKDTDATPPQIDHTWLAVTSRCQFRERFVHKCTCFERERGKDKQIWIN